MPKEFTPRHVHYRDKFSHAFSFAPEYQMNATIIAVAIQLETFNSTFIKITAPTKMFDNNNNNNNNNNKSNRYVYQIWTNCDLSETNEQTLATAVYGDLKDDALADQ
ncbi:hypothetical protein GQX74_007390 [Glossina fuscipes]|nr:hypothetical protein GQX74_007390 [Glossina fuscipes]